MIGTDSIINIGLRKEVFIRNVPSTSLHVCGRVTVIFSESGIIPYLELKSAVFSNPIYIIIFVLNLYYKLVHMRKAYNRPPGKILTKFLNKVNRVNIYLKSL